jgi:hypothetical protein
MMPDSELRVNFSRFPALGLQSGTGGIFNEAYGWGSNALMV